MSDRLSAEAEGVLVALANLRHIRHLDQTAIELADAGLADLNRGVLIVNPRGNEMALRLRAKPKRLAQALRNKQTSGPRPLG